MKKIIILEGIATSGKTTLKEKLGEYFNLKGISYLAVGEEETLMPILENIDRKTSLNLLNKVIINCLKTDADVIIFDRLYFTHIFRTKSLISDFSIFEDILLAQNTLLVLLTVEEASIKGRVLEALECRDKSWAEFVRRKGTDDEIADYYTNQQRELIKLAIRSRLKNLIIDATKRNYDHLKNKVIESLL